MKQVLMLIVATVLLSGCEPSFKAEYQATLKELNSVKKQLQQAEQKLKAADNEARQKIFALIRRTNNQLQNPNLDPTLLKEFAQELVGHVDRYNQLAEQADHVSITAGFYLKQLSAITELLSASQGAYERRHHECLTDINTKGEKNDLSTMLCEVQADAARQLLTKDLTRFIKALLLVTDQQLQSGRQADSSAVTATALEKRYTAEVARLTKPDS